MKFLGWLILGVIVLLILAGLLIQTRPVKEKLAKVASNQAAKYLNGNISLGNIDGNFFTHLQLEDVLWEYQNDTVAFISNLDLRYDLRPLLNSRLLVHSLNIDQPFFHLEQLNDSTWSIARLIKPATNKTDSKPSGGNFKVDIKDVRLKEGRMDLDAADSVVPEQIQQLNTNFAFYWDRLHQAVEMHEFSLVAKKPDLTLTQLHFNVSRDTAIIELNGFSLKTKQNQFSAEGTFQPPAQQAKVDLQSAPLQPAEFEFLLPDLKLPAHPELRLDAQLEDDSLKAVLDLKEDQQQIHLNFSAAEFTGFLSNQKVVLLQYRLNGKLDNINLAHWTGLSNLDYLINGNISAKGTGTKPQTAVVALSGEFNDCVIENRKIDKLIVDFNLDHGHIKGQAEGSGDFGRFNLRPNIKNLFDTPDYHLWLATRQFNLAEVLGNDSLQSDINMQATIDGRGFDPKRLTARANVNAIESRFQSVDVDTLLADVEFKKKNFRIDSLLLETHSIQVKAHGNYALNANSEMWLNARFDSIADLESIVPVSNLQTGGRIDARLWGTKDSLNLETAIQLDSSRYNSFYLDSLNVNATAALNQTDTLVTADLLAFNLQNNKLLIDSVKADVKANPDSMFVNAKVADNDIRTALTGRVNWQEQLRITLENWWVDCKNQHLALQHPPAVFEIDSTNYRVHNFKMSSNSSDTAQFVAVEGQLSRSGNEDLQIKVENVNVAGLMKTFGNPVEAEGTAGFNLRMEGSSDLPVLKGDFEVDNAVLNTYKFSDFGGTFDYTDDQLQLQSKIVPVDSGRIELSGNVPLQIEPDSFKLGFNPQDSIDMHLNVDRFPLAVLQTLDIRENIEGFIDGDIAVKGTAESPDPNGELKLIEAAIEMPEYGIDYQNIRINLLFLPNKINLDTLRIETADGNVHGSGIIDFSSNFYKGNISQSEIKLKFDQFNPLNHRRFNMQLSGNASLGGKKGDVVFDGDLNVPQAEIYLPAVLNMMGKVYVPRLPKSVLVQELEKRQNIPDTLQIHLPPPQDTARQFNLNYFNQLTGKLRVKIPKNAWIKNEDLRLEISGDLELVKHEDFIELFGSASVIRGQYDMLGRTFVIDEGTIRFEGGKELMPKMNITASYAFRDAQRQEKKLTVHVTGTAKSPSVSFELDGSAVNEGDALSYILFGKSMNELTIGQQDNLSGAGGGEVAAQAAASILSAQISNFLSKKLNVDYIEVKGSGDFDNATVVVGKYLTNDVFVSFEQRFGKTDQKDISKYEVKLEYELFKFLFLQLNNSSTESGFDVIFKLDSN